MDKATEFIDKYIELCREYELFVSRKPEELGDYFVREGIGNTNFMWLKADLLDSLTEAE